MLDLQVVQAYLDHALSALMLYDSYLLEHDVNERSITHKLAEYLRNCFVDYQVDCEYNRNIEDPSKSKKLYYLAEELDRLDLLTKFHFNRDTIFDDTLYEISVYPDIIIHRRGRNDYNLLVVEVKKSTSRVDEGYDLFKLNKFTELRDEYSLRYKYGVFVKLETDVKKSGVLSVKWFSKGMKLPE